MGLISPQQISDGTTADASDVNTPINTIANEFNGNIDNANIKSGAAIDGSKLAAASVTNTQLATAVSPVTRLDDTGIDYVGSGCVWTGDSYGGSLNASMTAGVVYVDGIRATVSAVTARAFTASKDTYVDISSAGTITYTEVANNAASPALSSGDIRVAIIQSGATITAVGAINQGQQDKILPIASSVPYAVTDSLGNMICNRSASPTVIGYRQITTGISTTSTSVVQATGLSCPVIVPTGRKVRVTFFTPTYAPSGAVNSTTISIWDGTVGSGTQITNLIFNVPTAPEQSSLITQAVTTPSSSSKTYNVGWLVSNNTGNISAAATAPSFIMVELV